MDLEGFTRTLYRQVYAYWQSKQGQYETWDHAYRILYSPPRHKPDLMIIGFNPGGNASRVQQSHLESWPDKHSYLTENWPLAVKMRALFRSIDRQEVLSKSVKTNLIFFRTPCIEPDKNRPEKKAWCAIPSKLRLQFEAFSEGHVREMINQFQPKLIFAEGFKTFDRLADPSSKSIRNANNRVIAKEGTLGTIRLIGSLHPTGAWVAAQDWHQVINLVQIALETSS